ncbi:hypothetical protein D3C81_1265070 [compost metagenome]
MVGVQVEVRRGNGQRAGLVQRGRAAQIAPVAGDMPPRASGMLLAPCHRTLKRPRHQCQRRQCGGQAGAVRGGRLGADAGAGTAVYLPREAGVAPPRGLFQRQHGHAQPVFFGQRTQARLGRTAAAEGAEQIAMPAEIGVAAGAQARHRQLRWQLPCVEPGIAAQQLVVDRLHRLDQPGLEQQRAGFAAGLAPLHPAHQPRQPHILAVAVVAREMGADALAQVHALAYIQRDVVVAIEDIDAGSGRHVFQRGLVQVGRQAGAAHQGAHRGLDQLDRIGVVDLLPELP